MMRTTVNLPDDVCEIARSLAAALAELARNGLRRPPGIQTKKAFPCFAVRDDAPPISLEATLQAEDGHAVDLIG